MLAIPEHMTVVGSMLDLSRRLCMVFSLLSLSLKVLYDLCYSSRDYLWNTNISVGIILFANLSYKEVRATVMGIGQVIGGVCRCLGPLLIPALYSWTCGKHNWLINSNFTFIVSLENESDG